MCSLGAIADHVEGQSRARRVSKCGLRDAERFGDVGWREELIAGETREIEHARMGLLVRPR